VFERYEQLKACKYIDEILVYETEDDLINILLSYPINVRILGQEYEHKDFTGKYECISKEINLYFNKRQHNFSTSELRQRVIAAEINKGLRDGHST
jgi:glycerol-3-phosphate cytidylyltransferase